MLSKLVSTVIFDILYDEPGRLPSKFVEYRRLLSKYIVEKWCRKIMSKNILSNYIKRCRLLSKNCVEKSCRILYTGNPGVLLSKFVENCNILHLTGVECRRIMSYAVEKSCRKMFCRTLSCRKLVSK